MQTVSSSSSLYFAGKEAQINYTLEITDPDYTPDKINLYVCMWGGTTKIKKTLIPDVSGTSYSATFDLNNVLYGELFKLSCSRVFAFPGDPDEPMLERSSEMLLPFYLDYSYYAEDEDGAIQEYGYTDNSEGTTYYAIQGGISQVMKYYLATESLTFLDWLNAEDTSLKFLSWIPDNMKVHPSQPMRIWFYNDSKLAELNLKVIATFTDGTESDTQSIATLENTTGLIELSCGPGELRLSTIDITKTVSSYSFWIEGTEDETSSEDDIKTEVKSFVIDRTNYERNDILFFRTSLGVNEVLWCRGRRTETLEININERTQPLATNALGDGTIRAYRGTLEYPFEMNTGWFTKSLRHYLADFLSAGEAKLPVNYFYMPVTIKGDKYAWGEDGDDLFAVSFNIQLAHIENFYSPIPYVESPWGDFNNDFNEDFF